MPHRPLEQIGPTLTTNFDSAAVTRLIEPRIRPVGSGQVRRLIPHRTQRMIGPFIFADVIGPDHLRSGTGIDIDAHPHIGLATVTYLFDGQMVHRDSTGAVATIDPGAVNWMTAGAAVAHTERSHPDDRAADVHIHGLQTWVALPEGADDGPAAFEHTAADAIPHFPHGASTIRVAAGTGFGHTSPVSTSSPLLLAEIDVADDAPVTLDDTITERGVIAIGSGIKLNDIPLPDATLAVLEPNARAVVSGQGKVIVLGGEPVGPRFIWWNFVHRDQERIEEAKHDWSHGKFPVVPGDNERWVPLPS